MNVGNTSASLPPVEFRRPSAVELFAGCGGLSSGLRRAGFDHVLKVEWNSDAVATLLANKAPQDAPRIVCGDVRDLSYDEWNGIDLVTGGPPCQPFSGGGKSLGDLDPRDMWPEAVRAVGDMRPRAFAFENVKGLVRPKFADYLADVLDRLRRPSEGLEYSVEAILVDAADFGAAQRRHRLIVFGFAPASPVVPFIATHSREALLWSQWVDGTYWQRHGIVSPAEPRKSDAALVAKLRRPGAVKPSTLPWVTVRDRLFGLGEPNGVNGHDARSGARAYPGHDGSALDLPAKALKAGVHGVPGGENMLRADDGTVRYFSVREAARLQGLADDYTIAGSWSSAMRQLGNAVPAELGEAVGRRIAATLGPVDRRKGFEAS